jgi:hypothetical protein
MLANHPTQVFDLAESWRKRNRTPVSALRGRRPPALATLGVSSGDQSPSISSPIIDSVPLELNDERSPGSKQESLIKTELYLLLAAVGMDVGTT